MGKYVFEGREHTDCYFFSFSLRRPRSFGFLIHTLRSLCNAFTNSWASMSASFMLSPKPSDPVKGQFLSRSHMGGCADLVRSARSVQTGICTCPPSPMQRRRVRTSSRSITW